MNDPAHVISTPLQNVDPKDLGVSVGSTAPLTYVRLVVSGAGAIPLDVTVTEYMAVEKTGSHSATYTLKTPIGVSWYSADGKWVSNYFPVFTDSRGTGTTLSPSFPGFGHGLYKTGETTQTSGVLQDSYTPLVLSDATQFRQFSDKLRCSDCPANNGQNWFVYLKSIPSAAALAAVDTASTSSSRATHTAVSASTAVAIASFVVLVIIMALVAAGLGMFVTYKNQSRALGTQM